MSNDDSIKIISNNRRASYEYELGERYEAGIVLTGGEIKSIRAGHVDLRDAYVYIRNGEAWLLQAHIGAYALATGFSAAKDERRERKLLLHKKEIGAILRGTEQKGFTTIATKLYLKKGRAKVEIALARGKKQYDKRQTVAKRDAQRDIERAIRER
ncbi:MAG: SsrA-binding protein SmpB [Chloroflexi bacterium]|nr:SsrA-binding protein SmpB [Chloroflexota bacterium]